MVCVCASYVSFLYICLENIKNKKKTKKKSIENKQTHMCGTRTFSYMRATFLLFYSHSQCLLKSTLNTNLIYQIHPYICGNMFSIKHISLSAQIATHYIYITYKFCAYIQKTEWLYERLKNFSFFFFRVARWNMYGIALTTFTTKRDFFNF